MNGAPRDGGVLALLFAGIAGYAAWRAIDAERRLGDPNAKPLREHVAETARDDLGRIREAVASGIDRAAEGLSTIAADVRSSGSSRPSI